MSKVNNKKRSIRIKLKKRRRNKLNKLKKRFLVTENKAEKEKVIQKIIKIAPYLNIEEYLKK